MLTNSLRRATSESEMDDLVAYLVSVRAMRR